jgi:hypothetical protein
MMFTDDQIEMAIQSKLRQIQKLKLPRKQLEYDLAHRVVADAAKELLFQNYQDVITSAGTNMKRLFDESQKDYRDSITQQLNESIKKTSNATKAANAKHNMPGGSRSKQEKICALWASGNYKSRDFCAEQEWEGLQMSISAARKALRNTPEPSRCGA